MSSPPTGTITFLFTDIEGSTELWQRYPDLMPAALLRHHEIIRSAIELTGGHVFQIIGDAFCAAFSTAAGAVDAAYAAQCAMHGEAWGDMQPLRVRMGLHTSAGEVRDGQYQSNLTLIRAQRIMAAGHGGQVLLSLAAEELVHDHLPAGANLRDMGSFHLKGLTRPEHLFQLIIAGQPDILAPLRVPEPANDAQNTQSLLGHIARGRLIGRSDQLRRLVERLDKLKTGAGGMVLVSGEPGIGKTRLIDETLAVARDRGLHVLLGRCHERDTAIPYLPITDAVETYARTCAPAMWERLLHAAGADLTVLLSDNVLKHASRSMSGGVTDTSMGAMLASRDSIRPERAVRTLLVELSKSSPCLLIVDDLHWADPSSLELIHHVALHTRNLPILILGAYREVELERTHPLSKLLVDLNHERLLTRERVRRFTASETEGFLAAQLGNELPPGLSKMIHEQTEGNPFFIEELVHGLVEDSHLIWNDTARRYEFATNSSVDELAGQIPQGIRAAIGTRLDRLDPSAQQALTLAAIIGRQFSLELLTKLASSHGLTEAQVEESLEAAQAARFIRPLDTPIARRDEIAGFTAGGADIPADFIFEHPLIHQVVYAEVERRHRRRLHAEVGRCLEDLYTGNEGLYAERLASHYLESDDDQKAVQYSTWAGDKMFRSFYDADLALGFFLQALEMVVAREPGLRHLSGISPVPLRRGVLHRFTSEECDAIVSYVGAVLPAAGKSSAAKPVAVLANRICLMTMHGGEVYAASIRLYEQCLLGPDVQKLVVETERGKLVGILEFPGPGSSYPVVLLLHGLPGSKETLQDEARRYWMRGLATLRIDLPASECPGP